MRLLQLASALAHVHALGIAHLDVKPANVLLAADGSIRLADFGVASRVPARRRRGTPLFVAPEILSTGVAGTAADAWSFGVVVYTLLVGFPPFFLHDDKDDPAELDEQVRLCSPRTLASAALALSRAALCDCHWVAAAIVVAAHPNGVTALLSCVALRGGALADKAWRVRVSRRLLVDVLQTGMRCPAIFCCAPAGGLLIGLGHRAL